MKSIRILITGANGQLGSEIRAISGDYSDFDFFFTTRQELDICDQNAVEEYVTLHSISCIINCAAYTAVDKAESEPEMADKINHVAVKGLAEIAKKKEIRLIHISTDYVFDGNNNKPYLETDQPNPQTVYGKSKLAGEEALQVVNPKNSIIIRTSWVYSIYGNNFVKTMLRIGKEKDEINVVSDQFGSPTNATDLAHAILTILPKRNNENVEVYHYSHEGVCSWFNFAQAIFENESKVINPILTQNYPTPAKRPDFSVLSKTKIKNAYRIEIPKWKDSLRDCIINFKKY
jgi:dTDP-4-dehydrorhamnose reductase